MKFAGNVIVIPWLVRLYVKIIHELWRVDSLTYRWKKHGITILYHHGIDLAHQRFFVLKLVRDVYNCFSRELSGVL